MLNCRHPVRMFIKTSSGIVAASMIGSYKNQYFSYSFREEDYYADSMEHTYNKMSASYYCSSDNENARNVRL